MFVADYDGKSLKQLTPSNCPACAGRRGYSRGWHWTAALFWSRDNQRLAYYYGSSVEVHDFRAGNGHVLTPDGTSSQDVFLQHMGDVLGWSTDDELLYVLRHRDQSMWRSIEEQCRIAGLSTGRSDDEKLDDRAIDIPVGGTGCGYKAVLSPDGSHFAVVYPQSGLRLLGTTHRRWQQVLENWGATESTINNELQGCSAEWTASGILGRCDYLRTSDSNG